MPRSLKAAKREDIEKVFAEHGVSSAVEPYFGCWREGRLDPSKPLESLARKSFMNPLMRMYGPLDEAALQYFVDVAKDYRVDGAINYAHVGCRQTCATLKLLKDRLSVLDVPVLNVDCDILDPTITTEEEVRARLEQFFELLEDR
jgi:benzoyl-CoA reductase/2-hydroxyglutaryl-CoA dehydratase subunit BcrC/BadD/HgdB